MKAHLGTFLSAGSPVIAELAAACGYDWLLLDFEHGCVGESAIPDLLRGIGSSGSTTQAIVRVGAPHADLIGRVLDWGAHGIMVPHVNSAAEAEQCVQALHYSPRGKRGFSRSARAYGYGLRPPEQAADVPSPLFMAQIETIEGVEQVEAIAAVDGVDVLFVGPADLQFDLRARPEKATRSFEECLQHVTAAASCAGKASGILVRDAADVAKMLGLGFTHIAVDSDLAILRKGLQQGLKAAREAVGK